MERVFRLVAILAWALWFGGMIALLVFVTRLFAHSRETGLAGAPVLFRTFAVYQLVLGAGAVAATATWWATGARGLGIALATTFLAMSFVAAFPIRSLTRQVDSMREAGLSQTDEFKSLHRRSSIVYTASAASLLIGGIALIMASTAARSRRQRDLEPEESLA